MAEVQVSTQQLEPPPAPQEQTQANNAINPQNGVASQDPGSEDEDEDEVPLGPDGLRLVSDCLAELTSDGSDGVEEGICLLCSARVKLGIITETPTSLSGLSEDEAVQHFLEQHKVPWEKVRHDI
ncbi:hypothetical protein BDN72DRAFT_764403 [Pluteus cervinus]|uniref:Uncharacterized protein n=1 Tax=Pluteus cervinus TaxID=181527 RepID=A0ACD3B455_9AGAR|nr:hypothetical protein BDN72DRAFT_764403 [Pluteus cervinus]